MDLIDSQNYGAAQRYVSTRVRCAYCKLASPDIALLRILMLFSMKINEFVIGKVTL